MTLFLPGFGLVILAGGVWLANAGGRTFRPEATETIAGFLLIKALFDTLSQGSISLFYLRRRQGSHLWFAPQRCALAMELTAFYVLWSFAISFQSSRRNGQTSRHVPTGSLER